MPKLVIHAEPLDESPLAALQKAGQQYVERHGKRPVANDQLERDGLLTHLGESAEIEVGVLPGGMESGMPSVTFAFTMPDGHTVIVETSLRLFLLAASVFASKYPEAVG